MIYWELLKNSFDRKLFLKEIEIVDIRILDVKNEEYKE